MQNVSQKGGNSPELEIPDHIKPSAPSEFGMSSRSGRSGNGMDVILSEDLESEETDWSNNKDYTPFNGFDVYFDFCSKVYPAFNQVRLTYVVQNVTQ